MILELGPGTKPHPHADAGFDTHHPFPNGRGRINVGSDHWPLDTGCVTHIYSSHLLEHVPHGGPLIHLMNEAWRVLVPGGLFSARFPTIGYTDPNTGHPQSNHIGWQPWADPTHVSYWWLPEAILYFCEGPFRPNAEYGIKAWRPLGGYIDEGLANNQLADLRRASLTTFWSIAGTWEGIVRIQKP